MISFPNSTNFVHFSLPRINYWPVWCCFFLVFWWFMCTWERPKRGFKMLIDIRTNGSEKKCAVSFRVHVLDWKLLVTTFNYITIKFVEIKQRAQHTHTAKELETTKQNQRKKNTEHERSYSSKRSSKTHLVFFFISKFCNKRLKFRDA